MGSCTSRSIDIDEHHHHCNPNVHDVVCVGIESRNHHKLKDFIQASSVLIAHSGSTDESFYDAQSWMESDCDEDFYSVNGDYTPSPSIPTIHRRFSTGTPLILTPSPNLPRLVKVSSTPSRTTTPLHVIFATSGTPQSNQLIASNNDHHHHHHHHHHQPDDEISSGDKKMRLLELFRLSRGGFADEQFLKDINNKSTDDIKTSTVSETGGYTPVSCGPVKSAAASNASSKGRRSIKAVHPIDCLRKLGTCGHKNEKKMDEKDVGEHGQ